METALINTLCVTGIVAFASLTAAAIALVFRISKTDTPLINHGWITTENHFHFPNEKTS